MEHPNAVEIMASVNNAVDSKELRYSPATLGKDSLELYFTVTIPNEVQTTGIFVAKRSSPTAPFGPAERIFSVSQGENFLVPEAPTISADGNVLMHNRMDCDDTGCPYYNIYYMNRTPTPPPPAQ